MVLKIGDIMLPSPTDFSVSYEIIWSSNTGRVANGTMVGDIVARKRTLSVKWSVLTSAEFEIIKNALSNAFFVVTFTDNGESKTMNAYSGPLNKDMVNEDCYKNTSVKLIEQ